jgi:hypothetical protein
MQLGSPSGSSRPPNVSLTSKHAALVAGRRYTHRGPPTVASCGTARSGRRGGIDLNPPCCCVRDPAPTSLSPAPLAAMGSSSTSGAQWELGKTAKKARKQAATPPPEAQPAGGPDVDVSPPAAKPDSPRRGPETATVAGQCLTYASASALPSPAGCPPHRLFPWRPALQHSADAIPWLQTPPRPSTPWACGCKWEGSYLRRGRASGRRHPRGRPPPPPPRPPPPPPLPSAARRSRTAPRSARPRAARAAGPPRRRTSSNAAQVRPAQLMTWIAGGAFARAATAPHWRLQSMAALPVLPQRRLPTWGAPAGAPSWATSWPSSTRSSSTATCWTPSAAPSRTPLGPAAAAAGARAGAAAWAGARRRGPPSLRRPWRRPPGCWRAAWRRQRQRQGARGRAGAARRGRASCGRTRCAPWRRSRGGKVRVGGDERREAAGKMTPQSDCRGIGADSVVSTTSAARR